MEMLGSGSMLKLGYHRHYYRCSHSDGLERDLLGHHLKQEESLYIHPTSPPPGQLSFSP